MREIKFRAWNPKAKKMYYQGDETNIVPGINDEFAGVMFGKAAVAYEYDFDGDTYNDTWENDFGMPLMQYTGLKDKNGKEIYEGDICKYYDSEPDDSEEFETSRDGYDGGWHDVELIGVVEWQNETAGFTVGGTKWWSDKIEVIGNIYENKELLK